MSAQPDGTLRIGVQTSSFPDLSPEPGRDAVDRLIHAMAECDVKECELSRSVVEPAAYAGHGAQHHGSMSSMSPQMMRRELRKWRLRTPLGHFESIGSRLKAAGIRADAYHYSPDSTFSDEEIDRGFSMAKALGAEILTASTTPDLARRVAPLADKHRMIVAFSGPEHTSLSPYFKHTVDIGGLTANNVDPVAYIRNHHGEIASLYLTDCHKKGESVVWGQGDTPITQVLQLLKRERWPIRAYVRYQNGGGAAIEGVRRCVAHARQALA